MLDILYIPKLLWRLYMSSKLKKNNVIIDRSALFNKGTSFGGNNVIHSRACVSSSLIGRYTYVGENSNLSCCKIGAFCSIGHNIEILSYTHPSRGFVSTSPVFFSTLNQCKETFVTYNKFDEFLRVEGYRLIIGNDVWIGANSIFIGGIKIGHGAIIAAGAVVTKDVPPYAIVAGVPARVIRYRFEDDQIQCLLANPWWDKPKEWLKSNVDSFEDITCLISKLNME